MTQHLPFEPGSVKIDELALTLETVDDEDVVNALQAADRRKGAAAVYERRVDAIRKSQPDTTDEDRERGYRITSWAKLTNYECLHCPEKDLDLDKITRHVAAKH